MNCQRSVVRSSFNNVGEECFYGCSDCYRNRNTADFSGAQQLNKSTNLIPRYLVRNRIGIGRYKVRFGPSPGP